MMSKQIILTFLWAAVVGVPNSLHSESLLDQSYIPQRNSVNAFLGNQAQTFTVGMPGFLTAFDVYAFRNGTVVNPDAALSWEIRSTFSGMPRLDSAGLLATGEVPLLHLPDVPTFFTIQLPGSGLFVQPGDYLAITLRSPEFVAQWWGDNFGFYDGGLFFSLQTGEPYPFGFSDLGFKTYVQPVPEPTTIGIVCFGSSILIMIQAMRRIGH